MLGPAQELSCQRPMLYLHQTTPILTFGRDWAYSDYGVLLTATQDYLSQHALPHLEQS